MISEFILFMGLAAVCFSGLLFTLWMLGKFCYSAASTATKLKKLASGSWKIREIMWLMVQIWFGNTYLSFAQAKSFHPVFGRA
jgi:hypothetical protein